jgi:prepilin-type N-terminal cleavage/methylation domain-containing protein
MTARRGTTLIELMVVIALMAVVAGVATPALRSLTAERQQSAAQRVAAVLRSARSRAIERGKEISVTLDPATGRFWLDHPDTTGVIQLPPGARITGAPRVHFRFSPTGAAAFDPIVVTEGGVTHRVAVDRWSGEVTIDAR